jgi:hypothetical protein
MNAAVLDLGTYKLKHAAGGGFAHFLVHDALPMLERFAIESVAYGASLDDAAT